MAGTFTSIYRIAKDYGKKVSSPQIGRMLFFGYDAKTKETLPTWDMFPLGIVVGPAPGGHYFINLHYVPIAIRKAILDELRKNAIKYKKSQEMRLKSDYRFLKRLSTWPAIQFCFKHHLYSHVTSSFVQIDSEHWDDVITMPVARWAGPRPRY